jgi:hypothetical protein
MMRTRWLAGGACALAPLVAAPVAADESPLAQVPDQAPLVVHVRGLKRTRERLLVLAQNPLPDLAPQVHPLFDQGIQKGLKGRKWNRHAGQHSNGKPPG